MASSMQALNLMFRELQKQEYIAIDNLKNKATAIANQNLTEQEAKLEISRMQNNAYSEFKLQVEQTHSGNSIAEMYLNSCRRDFFATTLKNELKNTLISH